MTVGEGDDALVALCRAEYPRLVGTLRLSMRDRDAAEELAQEAIARLCRDWEAVAAGPSPRAWLYRVGLNLATSRWRHLQVRRRVHPRLALDAVTADHAEGAVERIELRAALSRLSARERSVVVLRFFADLTVDETAAALGISNPAVRGLCHRALRKLRDALDEDVDVGEGASRVG